VRRFGSVYLVRIQSCEWVVDMVSEVDSIRIANFLDSIASPTRLKMLCLLLDSELSVGELAKRVDISASAASQHLARLRKQNLVETRRTAKTIHYICTDPGVEVMLEALREIFAPKV